MNSKPMFEDRELIKLSHVKSGNLNNAGNMKGRWRRSCPGRLCHSPGRGKQGFTFDARGVWIHQCRDTNRIMPETERFHQRIKDGNLLSG